MTTLPRRLVAVSALCAATLPLAALPAHASTEVVANQTGMLAAPTNLSPDDQTSPQPARKTVVLSWTAVAGATSYKVEVGTDDTWSDTPNYTVTTVNNHVTLPVDLPHATYVWRVAALKGSQVGHWSSETGQAHADAQFVHAWHDKATPLAPAQGSTVPAFSELSWTPVAGASSYEVQVSTSPFFPIASSTTATSSDTSPAPSTSGQAAAEQTDVCFTSHTRVTPYTNVASAEKDNPGACSWSVFQNASLHWRVRPLDRVAEVVTDDQNKSVSNATMSPLPPSSDNQDPKLSDCPGLGDDKCTPTHEVEFGPWSDVVDFTALPDGTGTIDPTVAPVLDTLANVPDGNCTVDTPASPTGLAEHALCSDFPTLSWQPVPGASRYRVTIALDDQMSTIAAVSETADTTWTPTEGWRDGTGRESFYWAVQACDDTECGAYQALPPSFSKKTPAINRTTQPGVTGPLHFAWTTLASALAAKASTGHLATGDAFAYHLQVAKASDVYYASPVLDVTVDESDYWPTGALADGDYIWRVQPENSSGHRLAWTTSGSFTRDATAPRIVSVSPASRIGTKQSVKVVFSETVTGLSSSSLTATTPGATASTSVSVGGDGKSATLVPTAPFVPGAVYTLRVGTAVKDLSGNVANAVGPTFSVSPIVDDNNAAMGYTTGWVRSASSNAYGGTFHQSATAGRYLTTKFSGSTVSVVGCLSPTGGYADVTVGSVRKRVSLYRSYSGCNVKVASLTGLGAGVHSVRVSVVGGHVAASKGNVVAVDYITAG